jgi:emp24/gp25L/p24 family/GOLD
MKLFIASVMILAASSAAPPSILVDEVFEIAPGKAGAVQLNLRQRTAHVRCFFEVKDGADVRPMIVSEEGEALYSGEFAAGGEFTYRIRKTGDYKVIFDNSHQTSGRSLVYVKIALEFMDGRVITATPPRQRIAIIGTLALFALIAGFAGWKIAPAIIERRNPPPPTMFD